MYGLRILPVVDQTADQMAAHPVEQLVAMEYLRVKVRPEEVDRFVQADRDVWTTFLSQQPGFLHKQVLCSKTGRNRDVDAVAIERRMEEHFSRFVR
jgi:hypothetical protein